MEQPRVAVIGTIFVDCKGFAQSNYNPFGRNLGSIQFVHGGVGRNVAVNLANLSIPTFFVSTVDDSALGKEVKCNLLKANIDLTYLASAANNGMGMWLAVLDENGNLAGSISQMPDLDLLERTIAEKGREIMKAASHVVLELDLNESISRKAIEMAQESRRRVYGIPGNLDVILKNRDLLTYLDCFICNDIEAGRLLDQDLSGLEIGALREILIEYTLKTGLASMVITLGSRGSVYYDSRTHEKGYQPAFEIDIVDTSGAGDAFFSGTVAGLIKNRPLNEAVVHGTRVASWTIQQTENTCSPLCFTANA
jgi:pseudouridine kinase